MLIMLALAVATGGACRRAPDRRWPPGVQQVSEHSPVLPPDAAQETFFLPPGYRLELVASEPLIADPVWIDIDPDGRLWVVEMRGFMPDNSGTGERAPVGRVVVLDDDNDDGRMDRSTVYVDGLVLPRSIKVLERGVLIGAPPDLWLARDTDGDGRADRKERVRGDYGRADGNPEHNANGLLWGLDNWIYTSEHDGHLRVRPRGWEHAPTVAVGQWGLSMDDVGRVFRNWNDDPLRVDFFPARYFLRNPNAVRTRGVYERVAEDLTVWPVRPNPGVNRGYREGTLHQDRSLAVFAAAGTPTVYRGDRLPEELRGNVFVTEPAGNLVRRFVVREDSDGVLRARNPYDKAEFIASTDERFRPVNLYSAPDGTLYIVDMYRGVIQHRQYQSEYLKNYIREHQLDQPIGYGRIYRVVHRSTRRDRKPDLRRRSPEALVPVLEHPNGWWRDTAQRLLVERRDRSVVPLLRHQAANALEARTRLHALWTLDGLDSVDRPLVVQALQDASAHVRAAAVRLGERLLRDGDPAARESIVKLMNDPRAIVRRHVALALGESRHAQKVQDLVRLLARHGSDPILVDAAVSSLRGHEMPALHIALAEPDGVGGGGLSADAMTMLAAAALRGGDDRDLTRVVAWITDRQKTIQQRLALIAGVQIAVDPRGPGASGSDPVRPLELPRRPDALIAASVEPGEVGERIATVLPLLGWAGKPEPRTRARPLAPAEQQRFAVGAGLFQSVCAPCHQADGRGRTLVAPSLVGSKWVLERPGLTARIVLNGKEGQMMMPPVALSDEQIAAVLTYIRRAWGHQATPVDASLVREVRGASTGRGRPWTEAELLNVTQPDGPPPVAESLR
jgi:mono/diheme cytochrome c family protein/glucose/arabinose dehydrogenase